MKVIKWLNINLKKFKIFIQLKEVSMQMGPAPEWAGLATFGVIVVALIMWVVYYRQNPWGE